MRLPSRSTLVVSGLAAAVALSGCVGAKSAEDASDPNANADAKEVTLVISSNGVVGGKNSAEASWISEKVIPAFVEAQKAKGVTAKVTFNGAGVEDEQYKTKLELNLKTGSGSDVFAADGIWLGELASAGYVKPLDDVVGEKAKSWDGWSQISKAVQQNLTYKNQLYGIPNGTDGRVLYFNKKLFQQAGLPADWQPTSWQEILDAGAKLKSVSGVTPIQINAGTAMGEATTMQGALDLLVGTGAEIYSDGKWQGNTQNMRDVLGFYKQLLDQGLMDKNFQQAAKGRDESFAAFAANKIGILLEGDYFWRSVINPDKGSAPMATRDSDVGYAEIPAKAKGAGVSGQDMVSMSGGGGTFLNPNTKFPQQAWELIQFIYSPDAIKAQLAGSARITARQDVNKEVLSKDPLLSLISEKVLPITRYRPGLAVYPQVSQALQQATADIVSGKSVDEAAATYQSAVEKVAGGADKVQKS